MIRAVCFALAVLASASASNAAEIVIHDTKSQPESMAVGPDGTLYVGSASTPYVYTVKKGATTATRLIDASAAGPGTFFFWRTGRCGNPHLVDVPADARGRRHPGAPPHRPARL